MRARSALSLRLTKFNPPPSPRCDQVRCTAAQRGELRDLAAIFRGSIVDVSPGSLTMEILGKEDKMRAVTGLLEPYGKIRGCEDLCPR